MFKCYCLTAGYNCRIEMRAVLGCYNSTHPLMQVIPCRDLLWSVHVTVTWGCFSTNVRGPPWGAGTGMPLCTEQCSHFIPRISALKYIPIHFTQVKRFQCKIDSDGVVFLFSMIVLGRSVSHKRTQRILLCTHRKTRNAPFDLLRRSTGDISRCSCFF